MYEIPSTMYEILHAAARNLSDNLSEVGRLARFLQKERWQSF